MKLCDDEVVTLEETVHGKTNKSKMKMTRQCFVTFQEAFTTSAFTLHRQYREIKIVHIVKGQMPSKLLVNENKQGYHKKRNSY